MSIGEETNHQIKIIYSNIGIERNVAEGAGTLVRWYLIVEFIKKITESVFLGTD